MSQLDFDFVTAECLQPKPNFLALVFSAADFLPVNFAPILAAPGYAPFRGRLILISVTLMPLIPGESISTSSP